MDKNYTQGNDFIADVEPNTYGEGFERRLK